MTKGLEMAEVLSAALESKLLDVHVALPARVTSYDVDTQMVEVALILKRVLLDAKGKPVTEALPPLPPMPVVFPRTERFGVHFPIEAGDTGQVLFNEYAIGQWLGISAMGNDSEQSPGDMRRHSLAGGVFIPGLFNKSRPAGKASSSEMVVGALADDEPAIHITDEAVEVHAGGDPEPVVLVSKLVEQIGIMLTTGIGATGTNAFAAAKSAWDIAMEGPLAEATLGATKLKAE
jgi:hypothetical protein